MTVPSDRTISMVINAIDDEKWSSRASGARVQLDASTLRFVLSLPLFVILSNGLSDISSTPTLFFSHDRGDRCERKWTIQDEVYLRIKGVRYPDAFKET